MIVRLWGLFRTGGTEAELDAEIRTHLEALAGRHRATGMSEVEAQAAACREFGGVEQIKERCRDERRTLWAEQIVRDTRYACRQIRKSPGFAITAVLTLALAIGSCTTVFTAIDVLLLHPLDTASANRTILIRELPGRARPPVALTVPAYLDLLEHSHSFAALSALRGDTLRLVGDEPIRIVAGQVSPDTFRVIGGAVTLGRPFVPDDFIPGRDPVVILTYSTWQSAFGGARDIVGRKLRFDDEPRTVVGVLSDSFSRLGSDAQVWIPLVFADEERGEAGWSQPDLQVSGILKPGVTIEQAQAELMVFSDRWAKGHPKTNEDVTLLVYPFGAYLNRTIGPVLYMLLGTVGCVLLIACANVANLMLARATARQNEISVRAALGASRGRLLRQMLVESVLLAVAAGGLGMVGTEIGLHFVRTFAPSAGTDLARLAFVHFDLRMLAFTVGFSMVTGVSFGLIPAWLTSRTNPNEVLRHGVRVSEAGPRVRLRQFLVALQVAATVVLLALTALFVRSLRAATLADLGYTPEHVAAMTLALRQDRYGQDPNARVSLAADLMARVRALPGVDAVALSGISPVNQPGLYPFFVDGAEADHLAQPAAILNTVTPDYFRTLGIRLLAGRDFDHHDTADSHRVAIVSRSLAQQYFPHEDPIGHHVGLAVPGEPDVSCEVVGVVGDVVQGGVGEWTPPQLYLPFTQISTSGVWVYARCGGSVSTVLPLLRTQLFSVDPKQPVSLLRPLSAWVADSTARQRLAVALLSVFGAIALTIAAVGIYGTMTYVVARRRVEFGIRMALGATSADILGDVLRRGFSMVGAGIGIGAGMTVLTNQYAATLLYKVSPHDPVALAFTLAVLGVVTFVACAFPALRATRVDPSDALRSD